MISGGCFNLGAVGKTTLMVIVSVVGGCFNLDNCWQNDQYGG